jgi:phenylacetate-CoA ligase
LDSASPLRWRRPSTTSRDTNLRQRPPEADALRGVASLGSARERIRDRATNPVILEPEVETRPWEEQLALDDAAYREQISYLLEHSRFYREKLAGREPGGLADIADLPLTEKDELRATSTPADPIGAHLCAASAKLVRIYSTSGTTGTPSYVPLTAGDLENWVIASARSYAASGVAPGERIVSTYNAGPFVAGAALASFERIGLCHVPVGTGNTERLLLAIELLGPDALVLTPSYAAHLVEAAADRGTDLRASSVRRVLVAGEPGGGEPAFRSALEDGWGARVTEAMGIGDIGVSLWGECEEQDGMHLGARGFVHVELIDGSTGEPIELVDGAAGELVLTHLRHRAAPLLRFRTRDHVVVRTTPCACGRTGPRVRCLGRTDDMLIVRGVNVFPTAVREVVSGFAPSVSGQVVVRPRQPGVKQEPPLPVSVELARGAPVDPSLADAIREKLRSVLVVQTRVELVPWGSLRRSEYKSQLVEWREVRP